MAFLDLLAAQERDRTLETGVDRLDGLVRVVRAREAEGESSGYDRMRAEQERVDLLAYRSAVSASLRFTETRLAARRAEVALDRATGVERGP